MKAMGVMIVPYTENCFECDYRKHNLDGNYCGARGHVGGNAPRTGKPDWCPLRPLPEKQEYERPGRTPFTDEYADGWNACLDAIAGGNDETPGDD